VVRERAGPPTGRSGRASRSFTRRARISANTPADLPHGLRYVPHGRRLAGRAVLQRGIHSSVDRVEHGWPQLRAGTRAAELPPYARTVVTTGRCVGGAILEGYRVSRRRPREVVGRRTRSRCHTGRRSRAGPRQLQGNGQLSLLARSLRRDLVDRSCRVYGINGAS